MGQTLQKSNGYIVFSHQLIEQFCGGDSVVDNMPRTLLNVPIRGRSLEEHGPSPSRPIAPLTRALSRLARGTQRARGRKHGITASKCGGKSQGEGSKASSDTGWDGSRASLNFRFLHRVLMRVQEVTHLILWSAVRGGGGGWKSPRGFWIWAVLAQCFWTHSLTSQQFPLLETKVHCIDLADLELAM